MAPFASVSTVSSSTVSSAALVQDPVSGGAPSPETSAGSVRLSEAYQHVDAMLRAAEQCADPAQERQLRNEAVEAALPMADNVAKRYRGRGIDIEDLTQVARMALVKAVLGYRSDVGHGFVAYAMPTISGEIKRHFRDHGWAVRPPRRLQEIRAGMARQEEAMRQTLRREPNMADLAAALEVDLDEVSEARRCASAYHTVSLEAPSPSGLTLADQCPNPRDDMDLFDIRAALGGAVSRLSERERRILTLRFVDDLTQADIGQILGVSQMQVSRLLSAIIARLRREIFESEAA